ncbi:hypothetical protein LEP1GSC170_1114 [Leptospira interrogans serovar Bataviae str. HAI135]|nr:hypothetical protein LEP1GSC170_1114 [Leptospira interrogans serovar Bataviae str. HAI135]
MEKNRFQNSKTQKNEMKTGFNICLIHSGNETDLKRMFPLSGTTCPEFHSATDPFRSRINFPISESSKLC